MLKKLRQFDWFIFVLLICLMVCGVIAIYSASSIKIGDEFQTEDFYKKQIIWIIISLVAFVVLMKVPYSVIDFLIIPLYVVSILLLIAVFFMPQVKGAHRWLLFGPISFQVSEMAKLATILLIAKLISKPYISEWQMLIHSFIILLLPAILILFEPDLGTAFTFGVILFAILASSSLPKFYLLLIISPILSLITSFSAVLYFVYLVLLLYLLFRNKLSYVVIGFTGVINSFIFFITPVFWNNLKEYQQNRILSFIDPMRDPFGAGYQIIQSKIAIGSGGFFGKGFLSGTQKNLHFLPEHHTDFIFSVIGEEFGFFGCVILLLLFFLFLTKVAKNLNKLKRKEMYYSSVGILTCLSFQVFVNIGMNIGIIPTTGIPLPFISYGGSNLLFNVLAVGLILKYLNERSIFD